MNTSLSIHQLLNSPLSCCNIDIQKAGPLKRRWPCYRLTNKRSSCNSPKLYEDGLLLCTECENKSQQCDNKCRKC